MISFLLIRALGDVFLQIRMKSKLEIRSRLPATGGADELTISTRYVIPPVYYNVFSESGKE